MITLRHFFEFLISFEWCINFYGSWRIFDNWSGPMTDYSLPNLKDNLVQISETLPRLQVRPIKRKKRIRPNIFYTACFPYLEQGSEMIISESI